MTVLFVALLATSRPGGEACRAEPVPDLSSRPGEDWEAFLGPTANGRSSLSGLAAPWPASGPPVVWHVPLGEGYCAPAASRGRLLVFDRSGDENRLRCLRAETGQPLWENSSPTDFTDMFGYDGGPRASPVIHDDAVVTLAADGRLECRGLVDGVRRWQIDTRAAYHVVPNFFGAGGTPLVLDDPAGPLVIVPVGGSPPGSAPPAPERLDLVKGLDSGLVAFDLTTGRERWRASGELASYSSPLGVVLEGERRVLAWMRDHLIVVDPADGTVVSRFRWRAEELFSVVAANPVVNPLVADTQVLLSETYGPGSVLLEVTRAGIVPRRQDRPGGRPRDALRAHWATPILHEGHLYGSSGRNSGDARLVCVEWESGQVRWTAGDLGRASVTLADGHLVVLGEFGDVVLVRAAPEAYEEVSRSRLVDPDTGQPLLTAPCWAAPVIARGLCFVRGQGRLVCIDLVNEP